MRRKPELEALEDRRLTAAVQPLPPLVHVSSDHPDVALTAAGAPGGALSILVLAGHPSASLALPHGGLRGNHNQTLLRVGRHKGRSR
jgi:hypothetical protein